MELRVIKKTSLWDRLLGSPPEEAGERFMIVVRQHPAVLLVDTALAVGGLAVAIMATATVIPRAGLSIEFIWITSGVLLVRFVWKVLQWIRRYFVITFNYRVLLYSGLVRRKLAARSLVKVVRIDLYRSIPGRLLGYGELQFRSISQDKGFWIFSYTPFPEQLFLELYRLMVPGESYSGKPSRGRVTAEI